MLHRHASFVAALLLAGTASANDGSDAYTAQVVIADARAHVAESGATTRLSMLISNETLRPIVFLGAHSPVARETRLMARVADGEQVDVGSWSIPPSGELVLDRDNLWVELADLSGPLPAGSRVPVVVRFTDGIVHVDAYVQGEWQAVTAQ